MLTGLQQRRVRLPGPAEPSRAPGVCRPATAEPSAVKSAFLFDKPLRCDPISVLQMPRFPVMLFFPVFFPTPPSSLSLLPSLSPSTHSISFFLFKLHASCSRPACSLPASSIAVVRCRNTGSCSAPPHTSPPNAPVISFNLHKFTDCTEKKEPSTWCK